MPETSWHLSPSRSVLHKSLCLYVYPPIIARQRLGKHVSAATSTRNNKSTVGRVIFYAVRVLSKESVYPLSLLGNISVETFPMQRSIAGGVVFYAVRVVSKESKQSILPRSSCYHFTLHLNRLEPG
jgi:hypothetical protein